MALDILVDPLIDPKTGQHIVDPQGGAAPAPKAPRDLLAGRTAATSPAAAATSTGPRDLLADKQRFAGGFDSSGDKGAVKTGLDTKVARDVPGGGESFMQGVGQGLSFGWLDELVGLADEDAGKQLKERLRLARAAHPVASTVGEVAGIVAPMLVAPGIGLTKAALAAAGKGAALAAPAMLAPTVADTGANIFTRMGVGAAKNALAGGAYSAGSAEGDAGDKLRAGETGALIGGAIGGAAPVVAKGLGLAAKGAGKLVKPITTWKNPEKEAAKRVVGALSRDTGGAPQKVVQALSDAQRDGVPLIAADTGEVSRAMTRSAANSSPEARAVLSSVIDQRFGTQNIRAATVLQNVVRTPANATQTREALSVLADRARRPLYKASYAEGDRPIFSPQMERLTGSPAFVDAMRSAATAGKNRAIVDGYGAFNPGVTVTADGQVLFKAGKNGVPTYPNLQYWDYVKRALGDMEAVALRAGQKSHAADIKAIRKELVNELDSQVPSYAKARGVAATIFGAEDALEAGEKAVSSPMENEQMRLALSKMTSAEQEMFREGFVAKLIDNVMGARDRTTILNQINASEKARQRLNMVIGPSGARELETLLRVENIMDMTRRALQGNSTTTRQLIEMGLAGGAGFTLGGANIYDPKTWLGAILGAGSRKGLYLIDQRVAQRVGEMMASQDPQVIQKAINLVSGNPRLLDALRKVETMLSRALVPVQPGRVPEMIAAGAAGENGQQPASH